MTVPRHKSKTAGLAIEPHAQAAAFIRNKTAVVREVFNALLPDLRARAFTVTGLEGADVLQRVRDEIASLPEGAMWDDVKRNVADALEQSSFSREAAVNRAELLIRTHGFQAYQAATYETGMESDDTTHWQYLTMEDERVRPEHAALDGLILPKDDPFWQLHFPPWDWGCRCRVRGMNPDLVDMQREADASAAPEDRLVIEGPALERLRNGQLQRKGRSFDVTPPSERMGAESAFQWHPSTMHMPLDQIAARYEPEVWGQFRLYAQTHEIGDGLTIWEWMQEAR